MGINTENKPSVNSDAPTLFIEPCNASFCQIDSDERGVLFELADALTFDVPNAKFMAAYKLGKWDGKIRLLSTFTNKMYRGIIPNVMEFAESRGYIVTRNDTKDIPAPIPPDDVDDFLNTLKVTVKGSPITLHDFQQNAVKHIATHGRTLILSPTGSGKSAIIYATVRMLMKTLEFPKILLIVPNTSLIKQMLSDFEDYSSSDDTIDIQSCTQVIFAGQSKKIAKTTKLVISTWQSIYKEPREFFEPFNAVFGDEVHQYKAESLKAIMEKCINAHWRIGTTGTLDGLPVNQLVVEGLFGPVFKATTAKKEIEAGRMSKILVEAICLKYDPKECKAVSKLDYHGEIDFLVAHKPRQAFIRRLALSLTGNTIILFRLKDKHGKALFEDILARAAQGRKVFYIAGEVHADAREKIRKILDTETDAIVVATYATCSTGVSINNLHNIMFASPSKSQIQVLQSLGRGTRLHSTKTHCTIYDIADDLQHKSSPNYTLDHFNDRLRYYVTEGHPYKINKVMIKPDTNAPKLPTN